MQTKSAAEKQLSLSVISVSFFIPQGIHRAYCSAILARMTAEELTLCRASSVSCVVSSWTKYSGERRNFLLVQAAEEMGKVFEVKISMGLFLIEF